MHDGSAQEPLVSGAFVSYEELERRARSYHGALERAGLRRGQRLAFSVPSAEQALPLFLAALQAGIVVVPIDPPLTLGELQSFGGQLTEALRASAASAVVLGDKLLRLLGNR
jgi:acyl-CoA synthetase (AMP-forming)/AMP-acid ligase II